ncbi:MAG TPA: DNA mismatch repair endonuclease MutL [Blastocatellia bacterium]|nr:DNA mismatch repair endonuclease MutL [Blastocatellia bacterium]
MGKIKVLPDIVANKIAAGEVVARPASAVKELLENALDAGATKISIAIEAGGKRLISVIDDGEGMTRDDAITAFERHATSKLQSVDELSSITTFGFRGEAMPSIAAVSRLTLRTKTPAELEGTELEFSGGKLIAVRDVAWPGGTEVIVKDIFFNLRPRREQLSSDATETHHVTNLVQHYALANPDIAFLLIRDGQEVIRAAPASSIRDRAYQVLGGTLLEKLIEVRFEANGATVSGFISNPQEQRSSRDAQYLFVNRRFVRDQLIGRALTEAYRSMMPSGTHPAAVLFIEVPSEEVDVNVHPAKTEVRFLHEGAIINAVRTAVGNVLSTAQPTARLPERQRQRPVADWSVRRPVASYASEPPRSTPASDAATSPDSQPHSMVAPRRDESRPENDFALTPPPVADESARQTSLGLSFKSGGQLDSPLSSFLASCQSAGETGPFVEAERPPVLPGFGHGIKPLGQIRDSYIVATDEEGLLLIDQHVAHERVLFEQFRDNRLARAAEIQPMLIPETMDLTPAEITAFEVVQGELEAIGIEVTQLSGRTIAIKTAPGGLATSDVVALVREVLGAVERSRRSLSLDHIREEIAASLACKAAIKVNMVLTDEKMQWLIDELMKTQNPMTCPHGRPIIMRVGLRDIERGFKRPV